MGRRKREGEEGEKRRTSILDPYAERLVQQPASNLSSGVLVAHGGIASKTLLQAVATPMYWSCNRERLISCFLNERYGGYTGELRTGRHPKMSEGLAVKVAYESGFVSTIVRYSAEYNLGFEKKTDIEQQWCDMGNWGGKYIEGSRSA